jgi:hypothetical protein
MRTGISLTGLDIRQLVLGIPREEPPVGPKSLGTGNQAEYSSDRFRFVGARDFAGTDLPQFPNRQKIILFPPLRHFGIVAFLASRFDDRYDSVLFESMMPLFR